MEDILHNLSIVEDKIRLSMQCVNRKDKPKVLLVTKKKSAQMIACVVEQGYCNIGESYLQEALEKQALLNNSKIIWHFIGNVQTNKLKLIANNFQWIHSIDRLSVLKKLNLILQSEQLRPINICIQVNISQETTKSGIQVDELDEFIRLASEYTYIKIRGIMVIPKYEAQIDLQDEIFAEVSALFFRLKQHYPFLDTLSMGMSNDFESAVRQGSTLIRIGQAVFGER